MSEWINADIEDGMIIFENEKSYKIICGKGLSFWASKKMFKTYKDQLQIGLPKSWTIKIYGKDYPAQEKEKVVKEVSAEEAVNMVSEFWQHKKDKVETVELNQEKLDLSFDDDDIAF